MFPSRVLIEKRSLFLFPRGDAREVRILVLGVPPPPALMAKCPKAAGELRLHSHVGETERVPCGCALRHSGDLAV